MTTVDAARETETSVNRRIVEEFARVFYGDRDVRRAFDAHVAEDYVQHNPAILDGREAAVAHLAGMFAADGVRFDVKRIVVDGELAMIHVHARPPGRSLALVDVYRLRDGVIVEHWDVIQAVPDDPVNPHAMF